MLRAFPRHSVDISGLEYGRMLSYFFCPPRPGAALLEFERSFGEYINAPCAIAVPSARLALALLLKHWALPEGAEIIISPFTHWSIFAVLKSSRLKPVFVDIDGATCNISPQAVKRVVSGKTKAIILTHMWGQPCEMDSFIELKKKFDIKIIEDCAMACGAAYGNKKVGSFGDAAIFSFGKAKAIAAFGGGMLCTNDQDVDAAVRRDIAGFRYEHPLSLLGNVCSSVVANILTRPRFFFLSIYPLMRVFNLRDPYNPLEHKKDSAEFSENIPEHWKVKMSDLQAVVAMEQLRNLDLNNRQRIQNAQLLNAILGATRGISVPTCAPNAEHIYLYYALIVNKRAQLNDIRSLLLKSRVDSQLNELTSAKELAIFGARSDDYPVFAHVSNHLLIIPNGIYLKRDDVNYVGNSVKNVLDSIA